MRIGLASPEQIRKWSYGEVKKPETINYRTLKPEREGLFCEKIFGPTRDWECHCGKYKRIRYKGIICDRCGVELTRSKVRRDRMGHIELAAPVSHIWYFKGIPSRMGMILDISPRSLEKVLYFASYIVLDAGDAPLMKKQLLTEPEYRTNREKYGNGFRVGMGAEAVKELLEDLDLDQLSKDLRDELKEASGQRKIRAIRRLEVVEAFRKSKNNPAWMILDVIPVIPPELRPMVQLDGGRFATSDLNDLYRRVINRNNRLKRLLDLGAPDIIVRNEKRMLQEAVDALIDNGRRGRPVTGPGNRPLKSLSDMLKGKQGRFRQNLLGKRVDYSGRSVIVVGPELKLHQCGLPKEMALELFKPFVMKKLVNEGHAHNIKSAKRMVERVRPEVWDVLEEVIKEHPVLLNRAPTLHRLGIQAFEPVLSEGRAIKIHPLVCTAYNADFDGDQMAIHVPLSSEAQAEARMLMLSAHNILSTKDGKPVATPTQDMVLGVYYLTIERERPGEDKETRKFANSNEAILAYRHEVVTLHERIIVKIKGFGKVSTTVGRLIFNDVLPKELKHFEEIDGQWHLGKLMDKKQLGTLVADSYKKFGNAETARILDAIKRLGFAFACKAGITIAISDIKIPKEKREILDQTDQKVDMIDKQYRRGLITEDERYKNVIGLWTQATDDVTNVMMNALDKFNPIYMMANSGARGNIQQIRQLAGMRGLMADPSGRIIDLPIKANFREGLTVLEYFISTHGARKGLADTALRTADSGYLTRRLVDVAQDVIVREEDCDVVGINLVRERARLAKTSAGAIDMLKDMLFDRIVAQDILEPKTDESEEDVILIKAGTHLDEEMLKLIGEHGVSEIVVRGSSHSSESDKNNAAITETISLGEPEEKVRKVLKEAMIRDMLGKNTVEDIVETIDEGTKVLLEADTPLTEEHIENILASNVKEVKVRNNNIKGIQVEAITEGTGVIEMLKDRIVGRISAEDIVDPETGELIVGINEEITEEIANLVVKVRDKVSIRSVLTCRSRFGVCIKCYGRNLGTGHMVDVGEAVGIIAAQSIGEPGTQLTMRTFHTGGVAGDDITQGLPRVEELFEARKPKRQAIITEISGRVEISEAKGMRRVTVFPEDESLGEEKAYAIPYGARLIVNDGATVERGQRLTEGAVNPHDILRVNGLKETQRYLVYEVQKVYKSQGVEINDKHIEVMVRQMLHKAKVDESGDTSLLQGEYVDLNTLEDENAKSVENGGEAAIAKPILLGITKASLATDSFLSAASFQETTRVLTEAAIKGKIDPLLGLKENVIIGKLIPAGTGMSRYRDIKIAVPEENIVKEPVEVPVEQ
ncbi:DNA-directed RNA polymerase subunit beta' [Selenomonadales bacterium OttesenSCG-928-I06]|nr:DNA-directed RNA polymerase subunit beta' [Selenomonadales bacterium OttesenSCG-928-I06]